MNHFLKDPKRIEKWLIKHNITEFHLKPDDTYGYRVDVSTDVYLLGVPRKKFTHIPIKFGHIKGNFYCDNNKLQSLAFAPDEVTGDFSCQGNLLKTLKGSPQIVGGSFWCGNNQLTSLDGCPQKVGKHIGIVCNQIQNLVFFPDEITQYVEGNEPAIRDNIALFYSDKNPALGQLQGQIPTSIAYEEYLKYKKIRIFHEQLQNDLQDDSNKSFKPKL